MNSELALSGVAGLIAWWIASLATRNARDRRSAKILVAIPIAVVLYVCLTLVLLPRLHAYNAKRALHQGSRTDQLFALISTRHPEINVNVEAVVAEAKKTGADVDAAKRQALTGGSQTFASLLNKYAPLASDEALLAFANVMLEWMRALKRLPDDSCARWMRQEENLHVPSLGRAYEDKMIDAAFLIFDSAFNRPARLASEAETERVMTGWMEERVKKRGEKYLEEAAGLLEAEPTSGEQGHRACAVLIDVYQDALDAPADQRPTILRNMFSQD